MDEPSWLHEPELFHVDYREDDVNVVNQINTQTHAWKRLPEAEAQEAVDNATRSEVMTSINNPAEQAHPSYSMDGSIDRTNDKLGLHGFVKNFDRNQSRQSWNPPQSFCSLKRDLIK